MKTLIITQNDPFYLAKNLDFLISNYPKDVELIGCIVFDVSPFGKRESFIDKLKRTYKIFGSSFVIRYGILFILNRFNSKTKVQWVLEKHRIPHFQLENGINSKISLEYIKNLKPELLISIAGNQIFKKELLSIPSKGTINLHTALLPKYRGLMPTFWVLKNNEKETGVSVFFVDEGIDSGPIVVQRRVALNGQSQRELIIQTKQIGMKCIIEAIEKIRDNQADLIENCEEDKSYYSFPTKKDVKEFKRLGKSFINENSNFRH